VDGDDRVAIAGGAGLALAGEADPGPLLDALGKLDVDCLAALKGDALGFERRGILERDRKPVGDVGAFLRRRLARAAAAEAAEAAPALPGAAAEQSFENVGQVDLLAAAEIPRAAGAAPETAGRPARMAGAEAERRLGIAVLVDLAAIILGALGLVGEDVVGAGDGGETFRGLGVALVLVGMQLLGELAIGLLDLGFAGVPLDAQL
jgi:hypothetical protein